MAHSKQRWFDGFKRALIPTEHFPPDRLLSPSGSCLSAVFYAIFVFLHPQLPEQHPVILRLPRPRLASLAASTPPPPCVLICIRLASFRNRTVFLDIFRPTQPKTQKQNPRKRLDIKHFRGLFRGVPEGIRTPDLLVRSQTLYPAELRAHGLFSRRLFIVARQREFVNAFLRKKITNLHFPGDGRP